MLNSQYHTLATQPSPPLMEMDLVDQLENSVRDFVASDDFNWINHLSANRSMTASGMNTVSPNTNQLSILYNGGLCVYDGIPTEKVHEIMLIAATAAKSAELKKIGTQTSSIPTGPSSPQGSTSNLPSLHPHKTSICSLPELPLARRQSLQRFLEKRRFRLGSRAPYLTPSTTKVGENALDLDLAFFKFKEPEQQFHPRMASS
ncbi:protein TIFY 3-like [Senna tora]|uniref:Protein TIFY n=1 Tax=Senna tora TaxID=362788 RepID=A0A834X1Z4_9FABA|nr:protein TIFY 3-like [Senna tora]